MIKGLLALSATYLALVFQTTLCPLIRIKGVSPDLLALAAMATVLGSRSPYAFLWAGWIGLLHDLASTGRIGVAMFWFALAGYAVTRLRDHVDTGNLLPRAIACLLGSFVAVTGLVATRRVLGDTSAAWDTILAHTVQVAVYTAAVALPFLILLRGRMNPGSVNPMR